MEVVRSLVAALAPDSPSSRQERDRAEEHYLEAMDRWAMNLDEDFFWDRRQCSNIDRDVEYDGELRFIWYWRGNSGCCLFKPCGSVQLIYYAGSRRTGTPAAATEVTTIENLRDVLTSGRWDHYIPPK